MVSVPGDFARNVEVLANGDVVISTEPVAYDVGLAYRSADKGASWQRERGAHNDARIEFAQGEGEQMMMVTGTADYDRDSPDSDGGCGCRTAPHRPSPLAAALAALGAILAARRRRARSARASP